MRVSAAATALPRHYYPQHVLIQAFRKYWGQRLDRFDVLTRLHNATGVDGRYLACPLESYPFATWGEANDRWIEATLELGQQAICRALTQAGTALSDIGAFFFVSITGVASPSIEARLMNRLRFSPHTKRIPIFGLGCVAGAAGIARAADYVKAFPSQSALLLSVELCPSPSSRMTFPPPTSSVRDCSAMARQPSWSRARPPMVPQGRRSSPRVPPSTRKPNRSWAGKSPKKGFTSCCRARFPR
jgi:predicted naringenin-chalcone synthase